MNRDAGVSQGAPPPVIERAGLRAPMRDGIRLSLALYRPAEQDAPGPVIVAMTPYIADSEHRRGVYFAANGLSFAVADVRGRGDSEGLFDPFRQEMTDAQDLVAWTARQPFCDGRVGMWGGSYAGHAQWAAAAGMPPGLATIAPAAAPYIGLDFPMRNRICQPFMVRWLALVSGKALQARLFADDAYWAAIGRKWYRSGLPFRAFDRIAGQPSPIFQQWLNEQASVDYWARQNPGDEQYARMALPILTITGAYDDNQAGAIEHHRRHIGQWSDGSHLHYLVIGPWDHAGTRDPKTVFGGVVFGPQSRVDLGRLHVEWYRWTLQGSPARPAFLKDRVAYFMAGAECWRWASTLDSVTALHESWFLDSDHDAAYPARPGGLDSAPPRGGAASYHWDPSLVDGPEADAEAGSDGGSLVDQALLAALGERQLVYETPRLERDKEVAGFFELVAWIAIDVPDTDLYASIHVVSPDGSSIRLSNDAIRTRYREGAGQASSGAGDGPQRYHFRNFTFVARRLAAGDRLRLVIAPMGRITESTFAERNSGTGGQVCDETAAQARPVTVSLFHDPARPSRLLVPIANPAQADDLRLDDDWLLPSTPC